MGQAKVAYSRSVLLRLRPSVVKSVPSASVFRSGSVMRITCSKPCIPYRSADDEDDGDDPDDDEGVVEEEDEEEEAEADDE